jgi:hypothetical protein
VKRVHGWHKGWVVQGLREFHKMRLSVLFSPATKSSQVVSFLYQPYEEKGNVLIPRMLKAVKAPSIPYTKDIRENEVYAHWVKGNHKLLDDIAGGFRNEGIAFINFADARVFWPPPMI